MVLALLSWAFAGPDATRDALDRLEEIMELRVEEGNLRREDVLPAILVSTQPRYEASADWFGTRAIEVLVGAFGSDGIRLCEACMAPRTRSQEGYLELQTGPIGLEEIRRLDDAHRGASTAARTAVWIDEWRGGVSVRIVDLSNGAVVFAQNIDPMLVEKRNSARAYTLTEEMERRARGDSLTQAFVDLSVYPRQHVSIDWTDQWGKRNQFVTGVTLSMVDPVAGLGVTHFQRVPVLDSLVGAKVLVSIPTVATRAVGDIDIDVFEPLLTVVGMVRVPFGRSNYGAVASVSTNGTFGVGLSLMNISLLPVLP